MFRSSGSGTFRSSGSRTFRSSGCGRKWSRVRLSFTGTRQNLIAAQIFRPTLREHSNTVYACLSIHTAAVVARHPSPSSYIGHLDFHTPAANICRLRCPPPGSFETSASRLGRFFSGRSRLGRVSTHPSPGDGHYCCHSPSLSIQLHWPTAHPGRQKTHLLRSYVLATNVNRCCRSLPRTLDLPPLVQSFASYSSCF